MHTLAPGFGERQQLGFGFILDVVNAKAALIVRIALGFFERGDIGFF